MLVFFLYVILTHYHNVSNKAKDIVMLNLALVFCAILLVFVKSENGGRLGRKVGSVKTKEQKETQYKEVLAYLKKGYSISITAKLSETSMSTVQRLKKEFGL